MYNIQQSALASRPCSSNCMNRKVMINQKTKNVINICHVFNYMDILTKGDY